MAYQPCRNLWGERTTHPCHPIPSAARLRALGAPPRADKLLTLLRYFVAVPGRAGLNRGSIVQLERFFRGETPGSAAPGWVLFAENDMLRLLDDVGKGELECDELAQRFECDTKGAENIGRLLPSGGQERREARGAVQIEEERWRRIGMEYEDHRRRVGESEMLWRRGEDREFLTDRIGAEKVERMLKLLEKNEKEERHRVRRLGEEVEEERVRGVAAVEAERVVPLERIRERGWSSDLRIWVISLFVFHLGFWLAQLNER